MNTLTEDDLEELLAQGVWAKRNHLEETTLINDNWTHQKTEYEQWQDELNAPRKPEPIWQVLLGGSICVIVVALLLLVS